MPISKNAIRRHLTLDKCFSNFNYKYYIEDLINKVSEVCGKISKRQIYDDIDFFKSESGWNAPLVAHKNGKRTFYRYRDDDEGRNFSIRNKPITDEELIQLQETINMLSRFNDLPQFKLIESLTATIKEKSKESYDVPKRSVISLQSNDEVEGNEYISQIFHFIINKTPVKIDYKTFHNGERNWVIHPYFLRQYNNRWYLIGLNEISGEFTHIGLDRIKHIEEARVKYIENTQYENIDEYFWDIVGITIPEKRKIEHVVLKFSDHRYPYVKAKPIHGSQKPVDEKNGIISLDIMLNKELEAVILNFGRDVEVLEPLSFRNQIATIIKETYEKYFGV